MLAKLDSPQETVRAIPDSATDVEPENIFGIRNTYISLGFSCLVGNTPQNQFNPVAPVSSNLTINDA